MIKVYTENKDIKQSEQYSFCSREEIIDFIKSEELIALDSETTGFDPHTTEMICIQLGNEKVQYVIDVRNLDISFLKILEEKLIIGQNLKFDLKFLFKKKIILRKVYDTFLAERVLYCGIKLHRAGLDSLVERYIEDESMDKSIRSDIPQEGLSERVIVYAARDVKFLHEIRRKQLELIQEKDLEGALNIENRFVPCLAYIEYCGFKLDVAKWTSKMRSDLENMNNAKKALDEWVLKSGNYKFISTQLDMFDPAHCTVQWSSPKQVVELFRDLGIDCSYYDNGVKKYSVEAGIISKYEKTHDIVKLYLEYKKLEKVVSTYGESFLKQVNTATGRIHTNFTQIMDTSRLSSGGKNKITKEEYINFQNIPADKFTRSCFVADTDNELIISDYSGQEQIVLANRALDKNLLAFYDEGLADMHSFVASKMYPELEGLTLDEIKDNHKSKRQAAKGAGFAINYGGQGITIADNLGIPLEEGNKIYDAYFVAFPGLLDYFNTVKKQGLKDGYVLINDVSRRKSFIPYFEEYKALEQEIDKDFWDRYRYAKANSTAEFPELKEKVSQYFKKKGDIERKTLNFPIQGTSAEITKISCIYIFDHIVDNGLFDTVKFVNTVHDENVLECPNYMSGAVSNMVKDAMIKAGQIFCKRVPLVADPEISTYWRK